MIRILYPSLLQFHPRAFHERFSDEMLCIFDEVPSTRERAFLPLRRVTFLRFPMALSFQPMDFRPRVFHRPDSGVHRPASVQRTP
jgi:hypothetical protein